MGASELASKFIYKSNDNVVKPYFWLIASIIVIHLDTFISFSEVDIKTFEISNLVKLAIYIC